ncbi:MAG: hypothetical protein IIA87_00105 [Nanoarchaeota archaeon]|nr:hypothetical protein [Nanoarchaeota archaeon]
MKYKIILFLSIFLAMSSLQMASAVVISSVDVNTFFPGEERIMRIEVKNTLGDDIEDVSLSLDLSGMPFIPIGSSEDSVDEIREDKKKTFLFRIRAANDIEPKDYQIPYEISFKYRGDREDREGKIGVRVSAKTELEFIASTENPVIGQEGKIILKIINKGFADANFVSVRVFPQGYTLLSDSGIYIGTVDSDDFETSSFNVIFNSAKAKLVVLVEYKDFNNEKIIKNIELPITVYSKEKAIELGIIKRNNTPIYIGIAVLVVVLWFIWRIIKKRRRIKQSRMQERRG